MTAAKTILITGAGGQLGRELLRAAWPVEHKVLGLDSSELDITDPAAVDRVIEQVEPDVVINAAAYTKVDDAESNEELAFRVNADGVHNLSKAVDAGQGRLIHISTDYVFDGLADHWYNETDPTSPIGAYGRSKLLGEQHALEGRDAIVLRTAWVYGALGSNFVTTMLRLANERDEIDVVADQHGCPTATKDLASVIVDLHRMPLEVNERLINVVSPDDASWYDFANHVLSLPMVSYAGTVSPITTEEYPTPAARPANSRLSTNRLESILGRRLGSWQQSSAEVVQELLAEPQA